MHFIKSLLLLTIAFMISCAPKVAKETTTTVGQNSGDFRSMAPKPGPAREIKIGTSSNFTLANGLNVIVVENHKLPQISYQLTIDRDPFREKEKAGTADITGSLLATGTTSKTKAEIDEAVDYIGANLSTNAQGGFASSLTKHSDKILALFSEILLKPSFPVAEFEKIKTQTLSGLQTDKDDPNAISGNVSRALTYGADHPYGEITNEITVSTVSLEDCMNYYKSTFKPGSAYLVIVGDITPDAAKAKAEKYFSGWSAGKTAEETFAAPKAVDKTTVAFVDKAGAVQSVINVTYAVDLKPGSADDIPGRVMNTILGSGFSGRLFKNLREDKAYTYGAYSSLDSDRLIGEFSANASVRNDVTDSAVTQFLLELNRMRNETVTPSELELAKSFIAGAFARSLESPQTVAGFALNKMLYNLPADYYDTYLQRLAAVTVEDVSRVSKKYITPDKARIIVVGNQDEVMSKLAAFDKEDGKVQLYDIYANLRKDESMPVGDVDPKKIIEDYVMAIGGKDKVAGVKSLDQTYTMEMMGMSLTFREVMDNGKLFRNVSGQGMNLQKEVYDGSAGYTEQMGQRAPLEGQDLTDKKDEALPFPELFYMQNGYVLEVKGAEDINGKTAYKMSVTKPSGNKTIVFFDKVSHLKVKEIHTDDTEGATTIEFSDYKSVEGILLPHTVTVSGPMPQPMTMKAQAIKVNSPVDTSLFKI